MTSEYKSAADEDPKQHIRRLNALIEQLIETNAQNVAKLTEVEAQVASAVADAHHFNRQAGEYEARLAEATRLLREMRSLSDIYPAEVDAFLGTADSATHRESP